MTLCYKVIYFIYHNIGTSQMAGTMSFHICGLQDLA